MVDPYRMVAVNIILTVLLLAGIFCYLYIYPKKKINLLALLVIISLLPVISIFRPGAYESGDFNIHVYRAMAFYDALKDGQFMPSWAGELNATYGYQLFIFNYSLPYYIISFFHFIGFSFITSMKLFLVTVYIFSGITMYLFSKLITKNTFAAFTASIFFLFAPYHLIDLHFRVTAGEITAYSLVPLLFYSAYKLLLQKNVFYFVVTTFVIILLNMAHMATSAFVVLTLFFYVFFLLIRKEIIKPVKTLILFLIAILLGMIGSIQVWIPYLTLSKYTYGSDLTSGNIVYPALNELLYSPWRLGLLFQGPKGEISFLIGYIQIALLIFAVIYLIKKRNIKQNSHIVFWTAISIMYIFLITPYSIYFWKAFPLLSIAMFSWRLLLITSFCISLLAGFIVLKFSKKKRVWIIIIFLVIVSTILNWGHRRVIQNINDDTLRMNLPKSTNTGEAFCCYGTPIWINKKDPWFKNIPHNHIEIIKGDGEIKELKRTSILHQYLIYSENKISILENTLYFPGWNAYIDKQEVPINYLTSKNRGLMVIDIPTGLHSLVFLYKDVPVLLYSKYIAIFCILCCIGYLSISKFRIFMPRKKRI